MRENRRNIWKIRGKCLSLQREYFNLTVMDIQKVNQYKSVFDSIVHEIKDDEGNTMEVWYARELQSVLGYARWENFVVALGRAMESCKSLKINVDDHFRELTKMIPTAKGAHRPIQDFMLTRYACYLGRRGDWNLCALSSYYSR